MDMDRVRDEHRRMDMDMVGRAVELERMRVSR